MVCVLVPLAITPIRAWDLLQKKVLKHECNPEIRMVTPGSTQLMLVRLSKREDKAIDDGFNEVFLEFHLPFRKMPERHA